MPRLLIAASGTGGHLFPAIAVADKLPSEWEVYWLGVPDRLENSLVPKRYNLKTVSLGGLQGNIFRKFIQLFKLVAATRVAISLIRKKNIDILFTTGGYIAAPAILAARFCRRPIILHESNALPGKVTRVLGRFCNAVAIGFPPAIEYLKSSHTVFTGTPVREEFLLPQSLPSWVPNGLGPLIVVLGGSQGAIGLNQMVREVFPLLLAKGCRIIHITGNEDEEKFDHPNLVEKKFTSDIAALFQNADLVISRAGSGTLCELALCAVPAILVPYPYSADGHQEVNAAYAAENGAALIVFEHEHQDKALTNSLVRLLEDRWLNKKQNQKSDLLDQMQKNMDKIAVRDSEDKLFEIIESFLLESF